MKSGGECRQWTILASEHGEETFGAFGQVELVGTVEFGAVKRIVGEGIEVAKEVALDALGKGEHPAEPVKLFF